MLPTSVSRADDKIALRSQYFKEKVCLFLLLGDVASTGSITF